MNQSDFLGSSLITRVALLDNETLAPVFESAHPMRVSIMQEKTPTKFAVEDGSDRSDHVVTKLTEAAIDFALTEEVKDAYEALRQYWVQNRLLTVQTKAGSLENMIIVAFPHDETPELGLGVAVPLRLQEWVEVKPETGELPASKVADAKQSSTVRRGQVTGEEQPPERKGSIMYGWIK